MQKKYLMTPGPTPVPAEVLLTMAAPIIHHRTPDFSAALRAAVDNLKYVFETEGDVLLFACSGTGVMESAVVNCFSAGDTVIVCRNGKFGDRQKSICETYGLTVVDLAYEWTQVVSPGDVARALEEHPEARGVIVTQSETSSGVLNDVRAIGALTKDRDDVVLIVDSITGIGAVPCKTDEWALDVVMTGSPKYPRCPTRKMRPSYSSWPPATVTPYLFFMILTICLPSTPSGTHTGVTALPRPSGGAKSFRPSASQPRRVASANLL
jgi:aspartate aminotransferase-like enzyme